MASTLRSAASVRTAVSGGGRSGGQTSGVARKTAAVTRPVRVLPKVIENNQDVTPKRLIDPEQFYNKVKDSILTQDVSSTVRISIVLIFKTRNSLSIYSNSQVRLRIQQHNHKFFQLRSKQIEIV